MNLKYWTVSDSWKGTAACTTKVIDNIDDLEAAIKELKSIKKLDREERELTQWVELQVMLKVKE